MTREQHFRITFISQLITYSSWQNILREEIKRLPLSEFPAFSIDLGKTTYKQFDIAGKAIQGEQEFTTSVYYTLPLRSGDILLDHSDIINIIEHFINDPVYIPPPVGFGDTYRIERAELIEVKPQSITFGETRFAASVTAKYVFTNF